MKNAGWSHLIADEVDVLLNLGHPLPEDSEQLWYGGGGIQKNLPALRLTGVKEGELWEVVRGTKNKQTHFNCDVIHLDYWNWESKALCFFFTCICK